MNARMHLGSHSCFLPYPLSAFWILFIFSGLLWLPVWLRLGNAKWFAKYGEQPVTSAGLTHYWHSWAYPSRSTCTQSHARNPLSWPAILRQSSRPEGMAIEVQPGEEGRWILLSTHRQTHRHTNKMWGSCKLFEHLMIESLLRPGTQTERADCMTGLIQG